MIGPLHFIRLVANPDVYKRNKQSGAVGIAEQVQAEGRSRHRQRGTAGIGRGAQQA